MAVLIRNVAVTTAAVIIAAALPAAPLDRTNLPIDIDAGFWELDRKQGRVRFRGITITQGELQVRADNADTSAIDFKDAEWVFVGSVRISTQGAFIDADEARLQFVDHRLRMATITGAPVQFRQDLADGTGLTAGSAETLEYDLDREVVRMNGDARLSEGANEIRGHTIEYDIREQRVIANAAPNGDGRVRITVTPDGDVTTTDTPQ